MTVHVSFNYEPDDPDDADATGVSEEEFNQLMDSLMSLGAEDIDIKKA